VWKTSCSPKFLALGIDSLVASLCLIRRPFIVFAAEWVLKFSSSPTAACFHPIKQYYPAVAKREAFELKNENSCNVCQNSASLLSHATVSSMLFLLDQMPCYGGGLKYTPSTLWCHPRIQVSLKSAPKLTRLTRLTTTSWRTTPSDKASKVLRTILYKMAGFNLNSDRSARLHCSSRSRTAGRAHCARGESSTNSQIEKTGR